MTSVMLAAAIALGSARGWETVGGNSRRDGLVEVDGPRQYGLAWSVTTLPATLPLQVFIEDTFCVTGRYTFSPNRIDLVCHHMLTGDTVWTRNYTGVGKYLPFGVRDRRVYVRDFKETQHDTLFCVDLATGDIIWTSPFRVGLGIVWSAAFTGDGDLLVAGDGHRIFRIDRLTGDTVWSCYRLIPTTGGECICIWRGVAFSWKGAIGMPIRMLAIDLATGAIVDSSDALPGDGDQEMPFSVGPDGTVYAPRDGGSLHALQYTDTGFVEKWRVPYGGSVWMQFGIGPDSTVYIPRGSRLHRLDQHTGAVLDSSPPLTTDGSPIVPRVSIDRQGYLFVTTGTYQNGGIWCLTPGLDTIWFDPMGLGYYTGPAIGSHGTVVAWPGSQLKCYQPSVGMAGWSGLRTEPRVYACPNPCRDATTIRLGPGQASGTRLTVCDASGRVVRRLPVAGGAVRWDGTDENGLRLRPGVYLVWVGDERLRLTLVR